MNAVEKTSHSHSQRLDYRPFLFSAFAADDNIELPSTTLNIYDMRNRTSLLVLSCAVLAACGGGDQEDVEATLATITGVEPIEERLNNPREVCEEVSATTQGPVKDENQIAGTAGGAVVGGALGNQIGGGSGKTIATAAGAVIGGAVGKKVQKDYQTSNTQTTTEQKCTTVVDETIEVTGYMVSYDIDGKAGTVRMDQPPEGKTIPVVNGQLVLQSVVVDSQ